MTNTVPPAVPHAVNRGGESLLETVDDVVEEVEEIFLPRAGGMIDRHRQERARKEAADREREQAAEPISELAYKSVKTSQVMPESFSTNVVTVPALGNAQVLPNSPFRFRATLSILAASALTFQTTPAFPASTVAVQNTSNQPYQVVVSGGTATVTTVNGVVVGAGDGTYVVPAYGSIAVTYTVAPTWTWTALGANVGVQSLSLLLAKDASAALGGQGFPLYSGNQLIFNSRGQLYAYNSSATAIQVVTLAEYYAPE